MTGQQMLDAFKVAIEAEIGSLSDDVCERHQANLDNAINEILDDFTYVEDEEDDE